MSLVQHSKLLVKAIGMDTHAMLTSNKTRFTKAIVGAKAEQRYISVNALILIACLNCGGYDS